MCPACVKSHSPGQRRRGCRRSGKGELMDEPLEVGTGISQPVCRTGDHPAAGEMLGTASHCSIPEDSQAAGVPSLKKASFPRSRPQKNAANPRKQGKFTSSSTSPAAQARQIAQSAPECRTGPASGRNAFSPKNGDTPFSPFL